MTQTSEGYAWAQLGGNYNLSELIVNCPSLEGGQTWADEFVDPRQGIEVFEEGGVNSDSPGRFAFSSRK